MQWAMLFVMGVPVIAAMGRIHRLRTNGREAQGLCLYRHAAWGLGLAVYAAMVVQEGVLLASGKLTCQTGLPLHLCSMMGVLTLPMLLSGSRFLWHLSVYVGLPGAVLALIFPAVLPTPWPAVTEGSFFMMHACLVLAPLLPLSLGWRPAPWGAAAAGGFLLAMGLGAIYLNDVLGSNYLFVSYAVPETPLVSLAQWGMVAYRLLLGILCAGVLAAEGMVVGMVERLREKRR